MGVSLKPGEVRIIGGMWKKTPIKVLSQAGESLRPSPDRVRETLFNWLGQDMSGLSCVDVFAGTGVLGFEAASRGANKVWLFEQNSALIGALEALKSKLRAEAVHIKKGDGVSLLSALPMHSLDVIFIDPPFDQSALYAATLGLSRTLLAPEGRIYLESFRPYVQGDLAPYGLHLIKHLRAGAVHTHLLARA